MLQLNFNEQLPETLVRCRCPTFSWGFNIFHLLLCMWPRVICCGLFKIVRTGGRGGGGVSFYLFISALIFGWIAVNWTKGCIGKSVSAWKENVYSGFKFIMIYWCSSKTPNVHQRDPSSRPVNIQQLFIGHKALNHKMIWETWFEKVLQNYKEVIVSAQLFAVYFGPFLDTSFLLTSKNVV